MGEQRIPREFLAVLEATCGQLPSLRSRGRSHVVCRIDVDLCRRLWAGPAGGGPDQWLGQQRRSLQRHQSTQQSGHRDLCLLPGRGHLCHAYMAADQFTL